MKALADPGKLGPIMASGGGDREKALVPFDQAGVNLAKFTARLQDEGGKIVCKISERTNGGNRDRECHFKT
jgi:hypothetical protein